MPCPFLLLNSKMCFISFSSSEKGDIVKIELGKRGNKSSQK